MAVYRVKRNGREYVYEYDRSKYQKNTTEYNQEYWKEHKSELIRKAKLKRIEARLSSELDGVKIS